MLDIEGARPLTEEELKQFEAFKARVGELNDEREQRRHKAYARAKAWERYMLHNDPPLTRATKGFSDSAQDPSL